MTKLERKAERLCKKLVNGQPCVICKSHGQVNTRTHKHHLIPKGVNAYYKYELKNLIPLCASHHIFSNVIAAHSTNPLAVEAFMKWLRKYMPRHARWYKSHLRRNLGKKRDMGKIVQTLQDYENGNQCYGEDVIFEN